MTNWHSLFVTCNPLPACHFCTWSCIQEIHKALRKRTQHCWPTTPNIVGCYMLRPFHSLLHVVICCCVLLGVVAKRLKAVKLLGQQLPTFLLFRDRRSVGPKNYVGSICTALITLLGPRTRITHGLQSLMGCILGSCCILLHTTANTNATTLNIVGANNVGNCCVRLHVA